MNCLHGATTVDLDELGMNENQVGMEGSKIVIEKVYLPPEGEGAEIIKGSTEEAAARLAEILKEKGVL